MSTAQEKALTKLNTPDRKFPAIEIEVQSSEELSLSEQSDD